MRPYSIFAPGFLMNTNGLNRLKKAGIIFIKREEGMNGIKDGFFHFAMGPMKNLKECGRYPERRCGRLEIHIELR